MPLNGYAKPLVVHVVTHPTGGGAEFLVRELNRRLPEYGVDSYAVCLANPLSVTMKEREECLGLSSPHSPLAIQRLRAFLKRVQTPSAPMIVHAHLTWSLIYVPLASSGLGFSLFYTEHNTYNRRRQLSLARYLDKVFYRRYQSIVCISQGVRDALDGWLCDPIIAKRLEVIYNGARILPRKTLADFEPNRLRLVSIGSLSSQKGYDVALLAVAEIRHLVSRYVIVGEGAQRGKLERLIRQLKLEGIVRLVGWADNITSYLHDADIALMPSRWEGFGLAAVEALSTGIPVIASDVPGLNEILGASPAGILVPPGNHRRLSNAVMNVAHRIKTGFDFSEAAIETANRYGLDKMVKHYVTSYRRTIGLLQGGCPNDSERAGTVVQGIQYPKIAVAMKRRK